MKATFALLMFLTTSAVALAARDLARTASDLGPVVIVDTVLAGVSAPPMQEKCSVASGAPSAICECGPNKTKVANPCIYCSTPSGKKCGEKRCKSCTVVCSPAGSVPPQSLACN
jgi:hypothetical protein